MTSAALIVVLVAGSFAFADIVLIKALGLGVAIAVALDATRRPGAARALDDAPAGRLELVDAATAGALWSLAAAGRRGRARSARPCCCVGRRRGPAGGLLAGRAAPRHRSRPAPDAAGRHASDRSRPPTRSRSSCPRDDGPHDRLTEWWYYTGHLRADDGRRFGFEFVIFRAERGAFPVTWASHLALTDETGRRFLYDQRSEVGPQVDRSQPGPGLRPGDHGA